MKSKHLQHYTFYFIYTLVFFAILYKVFTVPITHDEVGTPLHYNTFTVWEIMMYPDPWPNNHILNTLLTKLSISIFGISQWSIRLPNLLSFLIFGYAAFRILNTAFKSSTIVYLSTAILFIANPYLLDFFGLCRGYGMATSWSLLSMSFLITGFKHRKNRDIWIALITAIFASYANFTLLIFWLAITVVCIFYFLFKNGIASKRWLVPNLIIIIVTILYGALIYNPIQKMQSTNQFKYWTTGGFYDETIVSIMDNWLYGASYGVISPQFLAFLFIIILATNLGHWIYRLIKTSNKKHDQNANLIFFIVLLLIYMINTSQSIILGTPNLSGRTAIFLYPLFIGALGTFLIELFHTKLKKAVLYLSGVIGVLALLHIILNFQPDSVREWWFDQHTKEVIHYIQETKDQEVVQLKTDWHFQRSFHFYEAINQAKGIEVLTYDKDIDTTINAPYYYIFSKDYDKLSNSYEVEKKFDDRWLLKRK